MVWLSAHGVIRSTKDVDICPSADPANLERLAALLERIGVEQLGVGDQDFKADELSLDPTRGHDLAQGGNFRLQTPFGVLDLMQWVSGIGADQAYHTLESGADKVHAFGVELLVASLDDLRTMKRAAGRPQDLQDLEDLDTADGE